MEKKTCAWCKCKYPIDTMVVKHAGKHNTYWCCEEHMTLTMERKKKREEISADSSRRRIKYGGM